MIRVAKPSHQKLFVQGRRKSVKPAPLNKIRSPTIEEVVKLPVIPQLLPIEEVIEEFCISDDQIIETFFGIFISHCKEFVKELILHNSVSKLFFLFSFFPLSNPILIMVIIAIQYIRTHSLFY